MRSAPRHPPFPVIDSDSGFESVTVKNNRASAITPRQPVHEYVPATACNCGSVKFKKLINFKTYFVRL
jgi:hypothetical protein